MKWVGAEAIVEKKGNNVLKTRPKKKWRHKDIDKSLRYSRTKKEITLLESVKYSPNVLSKDKDSFTMEYIQGIPLRQSLERIEDVGRAVASMHDVDVFHGDLTPNNILLEENRAVIIDFGLGGKPARIEDKAVDLHILRSSLEALAPHKNLWEKFIASYDAKQKADIVNQLGVVEKRGRYK